MAEQLASGNSTTLQLDESDYVSITGNALVIASGPSASVNTTNAGTVVYGPYAGGASMRIVATGAVSYTLTQPSFTPVVQISQTGTITDPAGAAAVARAAGASFAAPRSTGGDQTSALQALFSDVRASIGALSGVRPEIVFTDDLYYVNGLTLEPGIVYNFGGAKFLKTQDGSGNFDSATQSVLRTRLQQTLGSWFGQADDIEIIGGTFDCNNKLCAAGVINLFNVRRMRATDLTAVHASVPYAGGFGMNIVAKDSEFRNPIVLGGEYVGHDAFHVFACENLTVIGGDLRGGDDAVAFGMEPWAEAWCDDLGLSNYSVQGARVRSSRASAVKLYVPTSGVSTGTNRGVHRKGRIHVTGWGGTKRGGGVFIQNEDTTSPDATMISDVKVYADLDIGSATHDGVNAKGVQVQNATNVSVEGNFRFTDIANPSSGYQTINSNGALASSLTGLTPATTYNFTVSVDGGGAITVNVLGSAAQTWLDLMNAIAAFPALAAVANVEWEGGRIKIISKTSGASSTVAITAGTLFTGGVPAAFSSIATAIPGQASPRFQLGYLHTVNHLDTNINCMVMPGNGGYNFVNVVGWTMRGRHAGIPASKYLLTADPTGTTTTIDASGVYAAGVATSGFLNPNTNRIAKFVMIGGDVSGVTTKINATTPATVYNIQGVTGMTSLIGGLVSIASGTTSIRVTPNTTPRMAYSAGTPGRALQQIKVSPSSSVSAALNWFTTEVDENNFDIQCTVAPGSSAQFSWIVNAGVSVV